ncbi:outer membrane surface antigen [Azospirillum brasilense]|uniref:Outer membrane surface antigen n=1 Tax=Azospirillum brasilense TaxID=192 RepID=A0A560BIQ4_AZOBR|nr:RT0821/Lpp0805 family surface protein [Azospirillum brasilense]TWA72476.1 outer membrane surface antigen [Azospirillum brasilense]
MRLLPILSFACGLPAVALALTLAAATPAQAQFGLFLGGRGGVDLTDEDWDLFRKALGDALTPMEAGRRTEWNNPKTGVRGDVTVQRVHERDGAPCGDVQANFIRRTVQPYTLTFCKMDNGRWAIAP